MKTPKYQIRIDNAVIHFTSEPVQDNAELYLMCDSIFDVLDEAQIEKPKGDSST
jgi:hypothetical protein